jgi:hypothetical protein
MNIIIKKNHYKLIVLAVNIVISLSTPTLLANTGAASFLKNSVNARSAAMGGLRVTTSAANFSGFSNPANLGISNYASASLSKTKTFGLVNNIYAGATLPFTKNSGLGLAYYGSYVGDIIESTSDGTDTGNRFDFDASAYFASFGTALNFRPLPTNTIYLGSTVKYIKKSLYTASANGVGLDTGILINLPKKTQIGLIAKNIVPAEITWDTPSKSIDTVDTYIELGLSTAAIKRVIIGIDAVQKSDKTFYFKTGLEYKLHEASFSETKLRAGLNDGHLTIGAGQRLARLQFDYAYLGAPESYIDNTHLISLSILFKTKKKQVPKKQKFERKPYIYVSLPNKSFVEKTIKTITIYGYVKDCSKVKVNGKTVKLNKKLSTFTDTVTLSPEKETLIIIEGIGKHGEKVNLEKQIIRKITPPKITLDLKSPVTVKSSQNKIGIRGTVLNASTLHINGKEIYVRQSDNLFYSKIDLAETGPTKITVEAVSKYGEVAQEIIEVKKE